MMKNMETVDRIEEKLIRERQNLNELEIKRNKKEEKIKERKKIIREYEMMLDQCRLSEANNIITANGLTLEEIMDAVKNGDLISLQEKIKEKKRNGEDH